MKTMLLTLGAAALATISGGCGAMAVHTESTCKGTKYLERAREAEGQLEARESELILFRERDAYARADRAVLEKEVALLKAQLDGQEIYVASALVPTAATTVAAGVRASAAFVLDTEVLFVSGSATLRRPSAEPVLERVAAELARCADAAVEIHAYEPVSSMSKGRGRDGWEFAGKRALGVVHWLENHGVARGRLSLAAHHADDPRVEVILVTPK